VPVHKPGQFKDEDVAVVLCAEDKVEKIKEIKERFVLRRLMLAVC
jgi:hypothetical protein